MLAIESFYISHYSGVKLCETFTGKTFSAGGSTNQRAETTHGYVKSDGADIYLSRSSLHQMSQHLYRKCIQQISTSLILLRQYVSVGKEWSDKVHEKWSQSNIMSSM